MSAISERHSETWEQKNWSQIFPDRRDSWVSDSRSLIWWQNHRMLPTGISSASIKEVFLLLLLGCLLLSDVFYAFFFQLRQAPQN